MALIARMKEVLPITVSLTTQLQRMLAAKSPEISVPERCDVIDVMNVGDEGGICCALAFGSSDAQTAHIVSLTHLKLDRRSPLSRDVEAYQNHRIKKLKRQKGRGF